MLPCAPCVSPLSPPLPTLTRSLLQPCPAPGITARCRGAVGGGDWGRAPACGDVAGLGDAHVLTGVHVPRPRQHPVPRGPQPHRPQHQALAQAGGMALQSLPLASEYHAVTTVISYCAGAGALPALLPGLQHPGSDPGLPGRLPAPLLAGPRNPQPPAKTAALRPPASGTVGPRERPAGSTGPAGASGSSLITACRERGDSVEHPPPAHTPLSPRSSSSSFSEINSFRDEICQAWLGSKGNSWEKFK